MAISGVTGYTNTYATNQTKSTNKAGGDTQEYLSQLKAKYPNVNITVADFKNERQEDSYMFGCGSGNNVVISSNIVEKMASDPETAAKYEKIIEEAPEATKIMKDGLASYGAEMIACGTSIDKNGKVTYWSIGRHKPQEDNKTVSNKKSIAEQVQEKREKKKAEEKAKQKRLEKAESMEKLLMKFRNKANEIAFGTVEKTSENNVNEKGAQMDLKA